jgi:alpha-1,6-mannosyltransferase
VKVCDLTQSYAEHGGGIRTFIHAKRDYLLNRTAAEHVLIVPGAADTVERRGRATVHTVASPLVPGSTLYRLLLRSDKVLRLLEQERPDIIDSHCAYNLPWTAFHHRRRHPCAVIGFYHTDFPYAYVEPFVKARAGARAGRLLRGAAERYARAVYSRCDATLAISPSIADALRRRGMGDIRFLPLGVDLDTFSPARREGAVRAGLGIDSADLMLIYAGRLDAERRPDRLIEMMRHLPESARARLVLVGDGPLAGSLAEQASGNARVQVLPFQADRAELARLLASADVYVSAMEYETFGLAVVEAQACGLPVLGVRAGAMIDRVQDSDGVLVDSGEPAALAEGLLSLDRAAWQERGRAARQHVCARFSWDRTFERLFLLYSEVLARRGLPAWTDAAEWSREGSATG